MNNCELLCPDLLELLALLAAKVEYLYHFYRNLSLSDLTDVKDCLAPTKDLHLVYDGTIWDAADQMNAELTIEPLLDSGVQIANITFNGKTTTLYCKDGTVVTVNPATISGSTMNIATITVNGVTKAIKSKDFTGDITVITNNISNINTTILNIQDDITEIWETINNLHPTEVTVLADYNTGTKIATITVNNLSTDIKIPTATNVLVNAVDIPNGTTIATITVDGNPTTIKAPNSGEGNGITNIVINGINGLVSNRIASLTLTGADIYITGYTEPEDVNEELELAPTDTVNEAFGKLAKALKDDEAAVTRAFLQVEDSTGFNDNLEYVPEDPSSILGNATNLLLADNILMLHIGDIETAIQTIRNSTLTFRKGASGTFNSLTTGSKTITIPWGGNTTNLMKDFPPENGNYYADILTVLSAPEVLPLLSGGDLFPGRCITFATGSDSSVSGRDIWKTYLYVGPLEDDTVSYTHYTNVNYWKEIV